MDTLGLARQCKSAIVQPPTPTALKPSEIASLAKAWDTLEERKRILRMKPAPKAIDVPLKQPKKERLVRATFTET